MSILKKSLTFFIFSDIFFKAVNFAAYLYIIIDVFIKEDSIMFKHQRILDILLKTEDEQVYVAQTTSQPNVLDVLANSDSVKVKMTVLANTNVSDNTLARLIGDENKEVWKKTQEIMDSRKKLA